MKKVAFHTLGCKLNFSETSSVGRQFIERGFQVVDSDQPSDVVVLNTCSVTSRAETECRQILRRALRISPEAFVVVTGCYAQLRPGEIAAIDGVDLVLGTREKFDIFRHAGNFSKKPTSQVYVSCIDETPEFTSSYSSDVGGRTRAFLKVQDGCDYSCSFCTIPRARGNSRSIPVAELLRQAEQIIALGHREIVLTGVNVGDYGSRIGSDLAGLLTEMERVRGLDRLRVSSIEPNLLSPALVDVMTRSPVICRHFHVPLQSGSDTILRRMRRRYVSGYYREMVESIRRRDPGAAIGADVIVGFPGETDRLFRETFDFLSGLPLSYLHVFTYSPRPGTPAAGYPGAVEPRVRFGRNEILRELGLRKRREFAASFVGRTLPVLFESGLHNGRAGGLTGNYIRVEAPGGRALVNQLHPVRIVQFDGETCLGEIVPGDVARHSGYLPDASIHSSGYTQPCT